MPNYPKHLLITAVLSLLVACGGNKGSSTGNSSTGNSSTGNSSTGNSSTGNSSTGNSSTGNSSTLDPNIERVSSCDENSEFAQAMLKLINDTRTHGYTCQREDKHTGVVSSIVMPAVNTVTWNTKLCQAAQFHSQDMAAKNFHEHDGSEGDTLKTRLQNQNYAYSYASENIAGGYNTAEAVHKGWLSSKSGHCENVMSIDAEEVGVAMAKALAGKSKYTYYWTENFASPL